MVKKRINRPLGQGKGSKQKNKKSANFVVKSGSRRSRKSVSKSSKKPRPKSKPKYSCSNKPVLTVQDIPAVTVPSPKNIDFALYLPSSIDTDLTSQQSENSQLAKSLQVLSSKSKLEQQTRAKLAKKKRELEKLVKNDFM